ncbi:M15 family metallopeptidase [Demequina sediminicola]|uniref:M15 family metallopeptidase n=1 Tax=Demequina sediminicola TaxID=1095026 RepID=UPI00128BE443|nr:M15 family metallopeptidase [Demequina sediminicola]
MTPSHMRRERKPFPWLVTGVVVVAFLAGAATARTHDAMLNGQPDTLPTTAAIADGDPSIGPITAPSVSPAAPVNPQVSANPWSQYSLDDADSLWVVVNKLRPLDPIDYVPSPLDAVAGSPMTPEAASAMERMRTAAADAGAPFNVSNAYRPYTEQKVLHERYIAEYGTTVTERSSLRPGYSEHQTGLAADIYQSESCRIKTCFADEAAGQWVAANAHEYGFVVRYPDGAEDTTGIRYEPWHVRYVGLDLARAMHESGQTMEEFFDLPPALDYH